MMIDVLSIGYFKAWPRLRGQALAKPSFAEGWPGLAKHFAEGWPGAGQTFAPARLASSWTRKSDLIKPYKVAPQNHKEIRYSRQSKANNIAVRQSEP